MRNTAFLIFLLASVTLVGCGGGGGTPGVVEDDPVDEPTPPETPTPDPVPSQLDLQLAPLLANANAGTPPTPPSHPQALLDLGKALFFDKILSGNLNMSCATCHHPSAGTGDDLSVSIGEGGSGTGAARVLASGNLIPRNAPALFNRGLPNVTRMFWDSRVSIGGPQGTALNTPEAALNGPNPAAGAIASQLTTALAAQAIFPLTSHAEMRGDAGENEIADAADNLEVWRLLVARLVGTSNGTDGGIPAYRTLFQQAYPQIVDFDDVNIGHVGRAIGAYEDQAFRALNAPFDEYMAGDLDAITDQAKRGAQLFYSRADCHRCHGGPLLSDDRHHAIAVPQVGPGRDFPGEDTGRFAVTGNANDLYEFRTPSLRNIALTGPYMHDGAYTSLASVVRHYDNPIGALLNYDPLQLAPLLQGTYDADATRNQARADALSGILRPAPNLSNQDVADIVAFLESLTDPASVDLSGEVPAAVPSGLAVGD